MWVFVPHSENISTSKNAAPFSPHTHSQTSPAPISCCFQGAQSRAHTFGFTSGVCLGVCGCVLRRCHFPREVSLSLPWLMLSQRNHQCARFRSSDMRYLDSLSSWGHISLIKGRFQRLYQVYKFSHWNELKMNLWVPALCCSLCDCTETVRYLMHAIVNVDS